MKMMITAISTTAITLLLTQNVFAAATRAITVKSCTARFVLDNIDSEISPAITEVLSQKGYVDQAGPGLVSAEGDANRGSATYDFGKDGYLTIEVRVDHFVGVPAAKYVDVSHIEYGPDVNSGKPAPVKIDHFYNKTGLALGSTDKKASRDILEIVRNMPSCTEVQ